MQKNRINTLLALIVLIVFCIGVFIIISNAIERVEWTNAQAQKSVLEYL